jgi:hypothetical protein
MTMTTLVVLMAALAEHGSGTGGPPATAAERGAARDAPRSPAAVTCTMRVVRRSPTFDAGILAPRPRVYGDALAGLDAIVRDAASACAGSSTRRVSEPRAGER